MGVYIREFYSTLGRRPETPTELIFGPKTVIVGPTQSGKSLIHHAIRSTLMWPRPKSSAHHAIGALSEAMHPIAHEGRIRLGLDTDEWIQAEWARGKLPEWSVGGALDRKDAALFEPTLIVDRARSFFDLNRAQRYRKLTERYIAEADIDLSPPSGMTAAGNEAWEEARKAAESKKGPPVDTLASMISSFESARAVRTKDWKDAEAQIKGLGVGQSAPDLLGAIEEQIASAKAWHDHADSRTRATSLQHDLAGANARLSEAKTDCRLAEEKLAEAGNRLAAALGAREAEQRRIEEELSGRIAPVQTRADQAQARIQELASRVKELDGRLAEVSKFAQYAGTLANGAVSECFTCGAPSPNYTAYHTKLTQERERAVREWSTLYAQEQADRALIAQWRQDKPAVGDHGELAARRDEAACRSKWQASQGAVDQLTRAREASAARFDELLAQIQRVGAHRPYDGPPVEELEKRREDAIKYRDRLVRRNALDDQMRRAQREKEMYRVLIATARDRLKRAAESIRDGVLGEFGPLMPEGVMIDLDPTSTDPLQLLTEGHEPYSADRACGFEKLSLVLAKAQILAGDARWSIALLDTIDINEAGERGADIVQMVEQAVDSRIFSQAIVTTHSLRSWGCSWDEARGWDLRPAQDAGWTVIELPKSR